MNFSIIFVQKIVPQNLLSYNIINIFHKKKIYIQNFARRNNKSTLVVTSLRLFTLNELTSRRFRSKGLLAPPLFDACVDSAPRLAHFSPPLPRHPSCPGFPSPESRRRTLGHGVRRRYSFSSLISSDIFIRLPFDFPSFPLLFIFLYLSFSLFFIFHFLSFP